MKQLSLIQLSLLSIISLATQLSNAQESLRGRIVTKEGRMTTAISGANIYWLNSKSGTISDFEGLFELEVADSLGQLVVSHVGYLNDTINIESNDFLVHFIKPDQSLDRVDLIQRRSSMMQSYQEIGSVVKVSSQELLKAACCTLAESFETNPSISSYFPDAISGVRQIRMLGLSSNYILITQENIPSVRGGSQRFGLSFTPGTWIESMQITKGMGSVTNGFESLAGQINVELHKPWTDRKLFVNLFRSLHGRNELNTSTKFQVAKKVQSNIHFHYSNRKRLLDHNNDGFIDNPLSEQLNIINRWQYFDTDKGWIGLASFRFLTDRKLSGQTIADFDRPRKSNLYWQSQIITNRLDSSLKIGYVDPEIPYRSIGLQAAYSYHDQSSFFGLKRYFITHNSFYGNLVYASIIGSTKNTFKMGLTVALDEYRESAFHNTYDRDDFTMASYFEIQHDDLEKLSYQFGLRIDWHNRLQTFITPKLSIRYNLMDDMFVRANVGQGRRIANIFAENQRLFASNRLIKIRAQSDNSVYGLNPERAWNLGTSITKQFQLFESPASIVAEYYSIFFQRQIVVDWEQEGVVSFYNLDGNSRTNNFQIELNYNPSVSWEVRMAYKNEDNRISYDKGFLRVPLIPKNRFFLNLGWFSKTNQSQQSWQWNFNMQYVGVQRQVVNNQEDTQGYTLFNTQLTRRFDKRLEMYLGGENLSGFTQQDPIIDANTPYSTSFDASQIYAPIFGAMYYIGLRWSL